MTNEQALKSPWEFWRRTEQGWVWFAAHDEVALTSPYLVKAGDRDDTYYHCPGKPTTS